MKHSTIKYFISLSIEGNHSLLNPITVEAIIRDLEKIILEETDQNEKMTQTHVFNYFK